MLVKSSNMRAILLILTIFSACPACTTVFFDASQPTQFKAQFDTGMGIGCILSRDLAKLFDFPLADQGKALYILNKPVSAEITTELQSTVVNV